jgi:hypothetical protein
MAEISLPTPDRPSEVFTNGIMCVILMGIAGSGMAL